MLVRNDDGVARCAWGAQPPDYRAYHDTEWGRRVVGEQELFERLSLEAFQSGLSWLTILRKRENFRVAFAGFDPDRVATFGTREHTRLLADVGIVRNARKIDATMTNARAVVAMRAEGGLQQLIETFAPRHHDRPGPNADPPSATGESTALARALKSRGFAHVGPVTCYSLFQACGFVNDHVLGCRAGDEIEAGRSRA